jgi:hypothetical protein
MNFKKPKEELLQAIRDSALSATYLSDIHNYPINSMGDMIQRSIANAVVAGFRTMIENTYTDQEFEQDIGLRDKV